MLKVVLKTKMAAHRRIAVRRIILNHQLRRPRVFRDRSNPLEDLEEEEIFERYRFRPETILYLIGLLPDLSRPTRRNCPLPPLLQILLCLRFLASGAMHLLIGDSLSISRSSAGRCIREVALHIANLRGQLLKFPTGAAANEVKRALSSVAGLKLT